MATKAANDHPLFRLLREDHRRIANLFDSVSSTVGAERESVILALTDELGEHLTLEEDFVYPWLEDHEELTDAIRQSVGDHSVIRELLQEVIDRETGSEEWWSSFSSLREAKQDHLALEEREVFPMAALILGEDELALMGEQLARRKRQVQLVPPSISSTRKPRVEI